MRNSSQRFLLLAAGVLAALPLCAGAIPAKEPAGPGYDFVYLGETRPILYRLHVFVDGRPIQAAWEEFTEKVFKSMDGDADGVLTRDEAVRTPPTGVLFAGNQFGGFNPPNMAQLDKNNDGKVTLDELRAYYRANRAAPFQLQIGRQQNLGYVVLSASGGSGGRGSGSADELNAALFKALDADNDGKLSAAELAAAPGMLLKRDADDDETVSSAEMVGSARNSGEYELLVARQLALAEGRQPSTPNFLAVTPGEGMSLGKQLRARYTSAGTKKIGVLNPTREVIKVDEATFQFLDVDGNGELDAEELGRFAQRPADVELVVRLGKLAEGQKAIELVGPGALAANLKTAGEKATLDLGTTRLDLTVGGSRDAGNVRINLSNQQIYKMQFGQADQDNNGYLDANEVRRNGFFAGAFQAMDRDGDGKLFEKEMLAYLEQVAGLQALAMAGCCSLNVSDQGKGLFDLLDANRDGRLSVREMRNAAKQIENLDRDGDQQVGKDEIPRNYQLALQRGGVGTGQSQTRAVAVFAGGRTPPSLVLQPPAGPVWFRKLDRNSDGDVSRREFPGTDEEFRRIDADGDGLIGRDEAERAKKDQ